MRSTAVWDRDQMSRKYPDLNFNRFDTQEGDTITKDFNTITKEVATITKEVANLHLE